MTVEEVLKTLESFGSEQTRKTYGRHGVTGPMFGVNFGDLKPFAKKLKTNHALALELWASGNHDARILALMIADPEQATTELLETWADALNVYVLTDALSVYIGKTPLARKIMEKWTQSSEEWRGTAGWNLLGMLATNDPTLADSYFEQYISRIEHDLPGAKNRVRYAMNNAVISIGMRNAELERQALAAAARIGKVMVDHGETNCKTPDAEAYIKKANARKAEQV
jgi:3-methyladenine DNA glycosylase AlkD